MKKNSLFFLLLLAFPLASIAKEDAGDNTPTPTPLPSIPILNRIIYGGNFGMAFDNGGTSLMFQPFIGYRLTNNFSAGLNFYYEYEDYDYTSNAYGFGPFARYEAPLLPTFGIVLHGEYDYGWYKVKYKGNTEWQTTSMDRLPLGAGVYVQTGARGRLSVVALWDVINLDRYSNSATPTIRVGYTF